MNDNDVGRMAPTMSALELFLWNIERLALGGVKGSASSSTEAHLFELILQDARAAQKAAQQTGAR